MSLIRLSKSCVGDAEKQAAAQAIGDGYLGMGKYVQRFEEEVARYLGAAHVVCVNTGTAALHVALMAIGLKPGDEVLVPSLTYVASFQAIAATGATPVACEVAPSTCTLDLDDAARRLTSRTRAIMPVHYGGAARDVERVYRFAEANGLRVVEDAAHAFGSTYGGRKIGSFGDVVCFSFDGIKNITSGEGGAIVTSDARVAEFAKDARLLSVQKDTEKRYSGLRSWEFDVVSQGYRYHMSNVMAAIGLAQLGRFETEFKPARQALARRYDALLSEAAHVHVLPNDYREVVPHIYPIRVPAGRRDKLREYLLQHEIECGVHYYPNHLLTFFGGSRGALPITERVYSELLTLPLHPDLAPADVERVVETLQRGMGA